MTGMSRLAERWRARSKEAGDPIEEYRRFKAQQVAMEENHRQLMAGQAELERARAELERDREARAARIAELSRVRDERPIGVMNDPDVIAAQRRTNAYYAQQLQAAHPYPAGVGQQALGGGGRAGVFQIDTVAAGTRINHDLLRQAMQAWPDVRPARSEPIAPAILPESAPRRFDFTE